MQRISWKTFLTIINFKQKYSPQKYLQNIYRKQFPTRLQVELLQRRLFRFISYIYVYMQMQVDLFAKNFQRHPLIAR